MATIREEVVINLGGDAKGLMKELNLTKQQVNKWARDIANEIKTGSIPESWNKFSDNAKKALSQVNDSAKDTGKTVEDRIGGAAVKAIAAFMGFNAVKRIFREISQDLKEVSEGIEKFGEKASVSGYLEQQARKKYKAILPEDQKEIAAGAAQASNFWTQAKIEMADLGALFVSSVATYANMFKHGESFGSARQRQRGKQAEIWGEMKALKLQEDAAKAIEKQTKDEKERVRLRKEYLALLQAEHDAWRKDAKLKEQAAVGRRTAEAGIRAGKASSWQERVAIAAEYNENAMLMNLPGNPTAGDKRNADQAALVERIRAYGAQKPKTLRERLQEQIAARQQKTMTAQDAINKLASIINEDAMQVKVKLAK